MHFFLFLSVMNLMQFGQAATDKQRNRDIPIQNTLVNNLNEFGYKLLLKLMEQNPHENVVMSPASISSLLAMTLLGSVGRSYNELASVLGFSEDILTNRRNHEEFGELLQCINSNESSHTIFANALFVDKQTKLREAYRSYLQRVYSGEVLGVNFRESVKVKEIINEWVDKHTEGKIEQFLKQPLPVDTQVILLSALYFSGQWARPFVPNLTRKMSFKRATDEVVADLMLNFGQFKYIASFKDDLHMIAFPYNDNKTTMYVLKPRLPHKLTLPELMERIDYAAIDNLINHMANKDVVVRLPKMNLKSKIDLEYTLKQIGVESIFNPREANFALMIDTNRIINRTEEDLITRINIGNVEERGLKGLVNSLLNPGVYVDSILHEVKINIDEYGTEAVAVTSGVLARSAEQFYADSPFYIFIRNEGTKLITFSAVIFDPTSTV